MEVEFLLEVSPEQDRLLQELVETYTSTVGLLLVQKGDLPNSKDLNSNLKRSCFKSRAIADAWLIRNRPERMIKLPSFRMNSGSYHITRNNMLDIKAFVFQGVAVYIFRIPLIGRRLSKEHQGVLTLFKDPRGWIVEIEPKRIFNKRKEDSRLREYSSSNII